MSTLPAVPAPIDWWAPPGVLHRVVSDLVAAELTALRRRPPDRALPWATTLHLIDDLDVDSLELLSLATRLSDFLHLHQSGIDDYLLARPTLDEWVAVAYTSLRQYAAQLTFRTSGSSGMPKPCPQPLSGLWQEIAALAPLFQGRRRILSAVPGHHIYGFLFTILLPQALQLDPGQVIDLRGSSVGALPHQLREGDLVVAHPDYWRQLQHLDVALPAQVVGVTSGAPCPDEVARAVRAQGVSRLVQVFGSSETAGIGWRDDPAEPYRCLPYWQADDHGTALLRRAADGSTTRFVLQDHLHWVDEARFVPSGRRDHLVQVGGINVSPARAAEVLRQHPAVADAAVRLMRPDEGNRLKAFVVPATPPADETALATALASWLRQHLSSAERPVAFSFGAELPRQANGKPADWA